MLAVKVGTSRQIVIPKAAYDALGLAVGDYLEVVVEGTGRPMGIVWGLRCDERDVDGRRAATLWNRWCRRSDLNRHEVAPTGF